MIEFISQPWHWAPAGVVIGLTVPLLLLLGNKHFGVSGNLRHACAACFPANVPFFKYNWKKEMWNLFFAGGVVIGAFLASNFLMTPEPIEVAPALSEDLKQYGINDYSRLLPAQLFSWDTLFSLKGLIFFVIGGFLVGFGARYAGGCTSGHAIMGLSTLQWPSLLVTIMFMIGGIISANFIVPILLSL